MRTPASPHWRFLLRGSALLLAMLALWWWVLLGPLLFGMRVSTATILWLLPGGRSASGVIADAGGGWMVRVPLPDWVGREDAVQRAYGRAPGAPPVTVRSVKLAIAGRVPTFFTLGFPLFAAVVLAAPRTRRPWRVWAAGSGLLGLLGLASMLFYLAYTLESTLKLVASPSAQALWDAMEYLNINVVSYVSPLLLAVWLHDELRAQIFSWNLAPAEIDRPAEPNPRRVPSRHGLKAR